MTEKPSGLVWHEDTDGGIFSDEGWLVRPAGAGHETGFGLWWQEVAGDPMASFPKAHEAQSMAQRLQDACDGVDGASELRAKADLLGWLIWASQPADVPGYEKYTHPVDDVGFLVYRQSSVARGTARNAAKFVWWSLGSGEFPGPAPEKPPTLEDVRYSGRSAVWRAFCDRPKLLDEIGMLRGVLRRARDLCQAVISDDDTMAGLSEAVQLESIVQVLDEAGPDR